MTDDLTQYMLNNNVYADSAVHGAIYGETDPAEAARAISLGDETGIDAQVINSDVPRFQQQYKATLASHLLRGNPILQDYINSHPLAAQVSQNDLGNLDDVSEKLSAWKNDPLTTFAGSFYRNLRDLNEQEPEPPTPGQLQFAQNHPLIAKTIEGISRGILQDPRLAPVAAGAYESPRVFSASLSAFGDTMTAVARGLRLPNPEQFGRDVQGMAEEYMNREGGKAHIPEEAQTELQHVLNIAGPWLQDGKLPPVGLHPAIDEFHFQRAQDTIKGLDDAFRSAQKAETRELTPDLFADFVRQHTQNSNISISAEGVRKLYGDKVPEADDNILGWVPGIRDQLEVAEAYGGRISVPLADYLAKVDPEVHKALHDDVALGEGGISLNEIKELKEQKVTGDETTASKTVPAPEPRTPIDEIDAVRQSAGLEPMMAPKRPALVRVAPEKDAEPGMHQFDINDATGKRVGGATISEEENGEVLKIHNVAGGTAKGISGFFGHADLWHMARQLQTEFPNARYIEGYRISGARETPQTIRIPLRPSPEQLRAFSEATGFVLNQSNIKEALRSRSIIPPEAVTGQTYKVFNTTHEVPVLHSFTFSDVTKNLDYRDLPPGPRDLSLFLNRRFLESVGETPIHIISDADMDGPVYGHRKGTPAFYDAREHVVVIRQSVVDGTESPAYATYVVQHEMAHAFSVLQMEKFPEIADSVGLLMKEAQERIKSLSEEDREKYFGDINYGFKNEREFVAEAFSNEHFQKFLAQQKISPELAKVLQLGGKSTDTIWSMFKNILKSLWTKAIGRPIEDTAIDGMLRVGEALQNATRKLGGEANLYDVGQSIYNPKRSPAEAISPAKETQLEFPGLTPMQYREAFEKASALGITEKQLRQYLSKIAERDRQDMEKLHEKALKLEKKRQTAEWKSAESDMRKDVVSQLHNRPDIAADLFLREGIYNGDKLKGRPRLDADKLTAEQRQSLPQDYVKSGGINPEDVATIFGYQNVDQMLERIKALQADRGELEPREHINKLADGIVSDRMRREFGDLDQNILDEAKDHVVSPTQIDILDQEMLALATQHGGKDATLPITKGNLDSWTKSRFGSIPISQHSLDDYLAAAGRAGRAAEAALLDDRPKDALKAKEQQSIALRMANLAKRYERQRASFDTLAKRLSRREITNVPQDYVAHLRDQLLRAGLPIGRSIQALAEDLDEAGENFRNFAADKTENDKTPFLAPDWMYTDWKKPLNTMTANEFSDFAKAIRQVYNYGISDQKIEVAGAKLDRAEWVTKASDQLSEMGEKTPPSNKGPIRTFFGKANDLWQGGLLQMETIFNRWDQGNKQGIFNKLFYDAASAANEFSAKMKYYSGKLAEANKLLKGIRLDQRLPDLLTSTINDQPIHMTVEKAIRIITDMGNASNRDKFVRGWRVNENVLNNWLKNNTTKEMWDFAEALGNIHEEIFSDLKDMIRSISGVVPDQVELSPFTDPHGVARKGWYSPMIYDQVELQSSRALMKLPQIDPNDVNGIVDNGYFRSTTATGAEIQRTGYAGPTDLSLGRLPHKMQEIVYDTAFRPFAINMGKLVHDSTFAKAIKRYAGEGKYDIMKSWYNDIVNNGKGTSSTAEILANRVGEYFRRNIVAQLIGWNLHTAEKHGLSAMMTSLAEVGVKDFAREFRNITLASPDTIKTHWELPDVKSQEIQRRTQNWLDQISGPVEKLKLQGRPTMATWRNWMLEKGGAIVAFSDLVSAKASWNAEYKKQLARLGRERPGIDPDTYDGEAISLADAVVRRAHGSTAITSRPGVMRSNNVLVRSTTSLYGFFNQMLQRNYEAAWRAQEGIKAISEGEKQKAKEHISRASMLIATSVLWPALVEEMVTPYTNSDKDNWGKWTAKVLGNGMSSMIPIGVRELVHAWINNWEVGTGIFDTGLREISTEFSDLRKGTAAFTADKGGKMLKDLNATIGLFTGVTNNEVGNVMKTLWDASHKTKETPRNAAETFRDVETGKSYGQPDPLQRGVELAGQKGRRR